MMNQELDIQLCNFMISWDALERSLNGYDIIDFNLCNVEFSKPLSTPSSRLDALAEGYKLLEKVEGELGTQDYNFKKLNSSITCLNIICGKRIELSEYIEKTLGFAPQLYHKDYLYGILNDIMVEAINHKIDFDKLVNNQIEELRYGPDKEDIIEAFTSEFASQKNLFHNEFGLDFDFDLKFEFVDVDAYWSYWIDGTGNQYRLRFNRSDRQYLQSEITQFCLHELIAHCGQASSWRKNIIAKKLPHFAGLLSIHSCEQVLLEGLAQGLPLLLDKYEGSLVCLRAKKDLLRQLALNNCYIRAESGLDVDEIFKEYNEIFPATNIDRLVKDVSNQQRNPNLRSYMFSYPKGFEMVYEISAEKDFNKVDNFINSAFNKPMLFKDIQEFIND